MKATTTFGTTVPQFRADSDNGVAALAFAQPDQLLMARTVTSKLDYTQPSERLLLHLVWRYHVSPVAHLNCAKNPATIAGFIIAVIIHSINHMQSRWTEPHIGQEIFKEMPCFTNGNAAPAVIFEAFVLWLFAALQHIMPCGGFWTSQTSDPVSMRWFHSPNISQIPLLWEGNWAA
jgi:hypothetical protein